MTLLSNPTLDTKPRIIYVGDPMCSWCYGFSPELEALKKELGDTYDFEIVMGGLRPYNKETMYDLMDFLSQHWKEVSERSGQKFNYGILNETEITYDTEPPSRATVIVRDLKPESAFDFFHNIQSAFYFENKNMHLKESYHEALTALDIDTDQFDRLFDSEKYKLKVRKDFERASSLGVRGFPTVLLEANDKVVLISNGYATKAMMIDRIRSTK